MAQARPRAPKSTGSGRRPAAAKADGAPAVENAQPVCSVSFCPICLAVTTASELRPEFAEHLVAAGREFLLALRALIDARLDGMEGPVKLERLTIE